MKNFAHKRLTSRQRVGIWVGAALVCVVIAIAGACATRTEEERGGEPESSHGLEATQAREALQHLTVLSEADRAARERTEAAEHEAEVVRSYEAAGFHYQITRGPESNRYTYRATEEDVHKALTQLEVEMDYLREQINETADAFSELERAAGEFHANAEDNSSEARALRRDMGELRARTDLLYSMRAERMREYETIKLQYETQKRMRESR